MIEENFDFEDWASLAQSDPAAFEAKRQDMIDKLIEGAPEELRQRLRSFQWRIDMERERSANPLQACIRISNMMWDLIYADRGFLWSLQAMADPSSLLTAVPAESGSADVIVLKPDRD
jgi:hypothetical protein